ncbi:hypothetical protein VE03_00538 [Pseudogymnoascus sp. 23342-1-I1]|nr:hypothetical protein VE03_00538 [Pseudogymnoascus sp. 23342-1-I1]
MKGLEGPGFPDKSLEHQTKPRQRQAIEGPAPWQLVQSAWQDDLSKALAHTSLAANLRQQETLLKGGSQPGFVTEDITQDDTLLGDQRSTTTPISSQEQSIITGSSGPYKSRLKRLEVSASGRSSVQQSVRFVP